ncbi:MAG: phosphoribosyltransferase-like protein [bacterium]
MYDEFRRKVKVLMELMWDGQFLWSRVEEWLSNFAEPPVDADNDERLHALFLLSQFSYFNSNLMRALLRALYRDLVQYPILVSVRRRQRHSLDWASIEPHCHRALGRIRFIGMGKPSESGTHLLYYFRQENNLSTELFVHPHELFEGTLQAPRLVRGVGHLIFLDDFCGSGAQATRYSNRLLSRIRQLNQKIRLSYFPLFATSRGLNHVRERSVFTEVETVCELDDSFRALEPDSRYFRDAHASINREFARQVCQHYGVILEPGTPLGYGDCQLLLGFAHNIPNNTLPVFWAHRREAPRWTPLFPRYTKESGW